MLDAVVGCTESHMSLLTGLSTTHHEPSDSSQRAARDRGDRVPLGIIRLRLLRLCLLCLGSLKGSESLLRLLDPGSRLGRFELERT
jgi:hypothetical protein